jgi:hypothetical protein
MLTLLDGRYMPHRRCILHNVNRREGTIVAGNGALPICHDIAAWHNAEVIEWHNREHHAERVRIRGICRCRRRIAIRTSRNISSTMKRMTPRPCRLLPLERANNTLEGRRRSIPLSVTAFARRVGSPDGQMVWTAVMSQPSVSVGARPTQKSSACASRRCNWGLTAATVRYRPVIGLRPAADHHIEGMIVRSAMASAAGGDS